MLASSPASMVNHIEPRRRKRYRIGAFGSCSKLKTICWQALKDFDLQIHKGEQDCHVN